MKRIISKILLLCLCMTMLAGYALADTVSLAYSTGSLHLRKGPGTNYKSVCILHDGDYITVEKRGSVWTKVRTADDKVGYIKNLYIDDGNKKYAAGVTYVDEYTVYTTTKVNFRSGAGTCTKSMKVLSKGTKLTVLGTNGDWLLVKTSNGTQGFVHKNYVSKKKNSGSLGTMTVKASAVHLRADGSTKAKIITTVPHGAEVEVIKKGNYWYKVRYKSYTGWIKKCYLK